MSDTYTKLFSSITESTVWGEPYSTRIAWVTMLAMADAYGCVFGSVPGLARRANITREEVDQALESFYAPDLDSRTKDHDGRRVEPIDGGWRLINHAKYAQIRNADERREYMREFMRKKRAEEHKEQQPESLAPVSTVSNSLAELAGLAPPALALAPTLDKATARSKAIGASASGSRLDPAWQPTPELLAWAKDKRPEIDALEATEDFRDHWAAQPGAKGKKLDWPATWRKWIRSPLTKPKRVDHGKPHSAQPRESVADLAARRYAGIVARTGQRNAG